MMLIARVGTAIDYQSRLLGQNRVGSVRVSSKAAGCVLLRLQLDTLSKTCRADCCSESNIGTGVSFYGLALGIQNQPILMFDEPSRRLS